VDVNIINTTKIEKTSTYSPGQTVFVYRNDRYYYPAIINDVFDKRIRVTFLKGGSAKVSKKHIIELDEALKTMRFERTWDSKYFKVYSNVVIANCKPLTVSYGSVFSEDVELRHLRCSKPEETTYNYSGRSVDVFFRTIFGIIGGAFGGFIGGAVGVLAGLWDDINNIMQAEVLLYGYSNILWINGDNGIIMGIIPGAIAGISGVGFGHFRWQLWIPFVCGAMGGFITGAIYGDSYLAIILGLSCAFGASGGAYLGLHISKNTFK